MVSCGDCHQKTDIEQTSIIFSSMNAECEFCHNDIHEGQFLVEGISDCNRCHAFENWNPEKFDHEKAQFKLEGAHKDVECAKCHPKVEVNGNTITKFKLEEFKCASCHT